MERTRDHVGDRVFWGSVERDTQRETERVRKALLPGIVLPRAQAGLVLVQNNQSTSKFLQLGTGPNFQPISAPVVQAA